jgi:hypothetical protein
MWIAISVLMAVGLVLLSWRLRGGYRSWPLLVGAAAWSLFARYELWFETTYDPRGKFDIRIDVLFFMFGCLVVTFLCAIWSFRRR